MGKLRSWRTTAVIVIAVAIAVVAVWKLRTSQSPAAPDPAPVKVGPKGTAPHRLSTPATPADDAPQPPERGEPTAPQPDDTVAARPIAELLRAVPDEMRDAAAHCLDPARHPPNSAERVTFRYTVVYTEGEASVAEVIPVDTNMADEDLQNCILDAVEELVWPVAGARERSSPRQQLSISIHDLSTRATASDREP